MTMTLKESETVADLIVEIAMITAQMIRYPEGSPVRPHYNALLEQKRAELVKALIVT